MQPVDYGEDSPEGAPPLKSVVLVWMFWLRASSWTAMTCAMVSRIQKAATLMVILVNRSPAREPKALEPPTPPKAPASPPPLPRWINTNRIRKSPSSNTNQFKKTGTHDHTATTFTAVSFPNRWRVNSGINQAVIIRNSLEGGKDRKRLV